MEKKRARQLVMRQGRNGMVNTVQKTFGVTTGLTGVFGRDWDYELALSHSQYKAEVSWPGPPLRPMSMPADN